MCIRDRCRELAVVCNPKEELSFDYVADQRSVKDSNPGSLNDWTQLYGNWLTGDRATSMCSSVTDPSINRIIVEGNEHPIHPEWIRSLRDQCLDASVPFNFASWGEWAPRTTHGESLTGQDQHTAFIDGMPGGKYPEDYRMVNWGRERSGRLLDGIEHNGE